jgi:hypothetical protein
MCSRHVNLKKKDALSYSLNFGAEVAYENVTILVDFLSAIVTLVFVMFFVALQIVGPAETKVLSLKDLWIALLSRSRVRSDARRVHTMMNAGFA